MSKEDLKFFIPYLGTLLIFIGSIKLVLFYKLFAIDITFYLDFSEILTLFLSDVILIVFTIFFAIGIVIFWIAKGKSRINITSSIFERNLIKRIWAYSLAAPLIIKANFLCSIIISLLTFFFYKTPLILVLCMNGTAIGSCLILILILEYRRICYIKRIHNPNQVYVFSLFSFALVVLMVVTFTFIDYDRVKYRKKYYGSTIVYRGKEIKSDSSYYLIGKTRNYIFYYDEKNEKTDVFPMEGIDKLTIKQLLR